MKKLLAMFMFLGAVISVASTTSAAPAGTTAAPKAEPEVVYRACTPAQLQACRARDPYGSGCIVENGKPVCLYE